jgi:hypothetical protein
VRPIQSSVSLNTKSSSSSGSADKSNASGDTISDVDGKSEEDKSSGVQQPEEDKTFVQYCSGESTSDMFGGNSNWRGPVWIASEWYWCRLTRLYVRYYCS